MSEYNKRTVTGLGAEGKRMRDAWRERRSALRPLLLDFEKKLAEVVRECPGIFRGEDEGECGDCHECIVQFKVRDGKLISYGLTGCEALGGVFIRRMPVEEGGANE